jgi:hypothetical protein
MRSRPLFSVTLCNAKLGQSQPARKFRIQERVPSAGCRMKCDASGSVDKPISRGGGQAGQSELDANRPAPLK